MTCAERTSRCSFFRVGSGALPGDQPSAKRNRSKYSGIALTALGTDTVGRGSGRIGTLNSGRDLWRWLVALAVVPLWLEWWISYEARSAAGWWSHRMSRRCAPPGISLRDDLGLREQDAETHRHQLIK
jgi:hypothetical protein